MIRVLLAEDQAMVREALATLLTLEDDIEVVAQVSRGDEVAAAALAQALPACRTLILTTFGRPGYLRRAMEAGVSGFLVKDAPAAELARSIRRALAGERVVDPALAIAALADGPNPLTSREREVMLASRHEPTVADIADALHLSSGTVRNHLSAVMTKLGAHNRAEALRMAEEQGWL